MFLQCKWFPTMVLVLLLVPACGFAQKRDYLEAVRASAEKGWREYPAMISRWKQSAQTNVLWGYNSPGEPLYLAGVMGFLYRETGEQRYADRAAQILAEYGDLRASMPPGFAKSRVEYEHGVPALANFFFLPPYIRAYHAIRENRSINSATKEKIVRDITGSVEFVFRFPEWGAHNRAMLRAEGLWFAAESFRDHPGAAQWRRTAEAIAADNLGQWEVEDATGYHAVWLHSMLSYMEASGRADAPNSPVMRYYFEYFRSLLTPDGLLPDFGDANIGSVNEGLRFVAIFEKGAAVTRDPGLKWAAQSFYRHRQSDTVSAGAAFYLCDAYRWCDETLPAHRPDLHTQEVLEDLIGKKVVFRNGQDSLGTYLLLNYRDEGDGGWMSRRYLRQTISVEEEKMHHGHADENSIILLKHRGSVLLRDAGYRSGLPSGPLGAWRADYYHNRLVVRNNKRDAAQSVLGFVQNSGNYRPVRTQKVDVVKVQHAELSRTRVTDDNIGYQWDRIIVHLPEPGVFLVVDDIQALRSDYFTFTNFWHTRKILGRGEHTVDIVTDSVENIRYPDAAALRLHFLETYAKTEGEEQISRHYQMERALYQTMGGQYKAGDRELFVTALIPFERGGGAQQIPSVRRIPTSAPYRSVAVEIESRGVRTLVGIKTDLEMEVARENIRPRYQYDLGRVDYGEYETDAHLLVVRKEGASAAVSAVNVLRVKTQGRELMHALPNIHTLQLDGTSERVGYSKWRLWEGKE